MIDSLYQDSIDKSLDDRMYRPGAVPTPPPVGPAFSGVALAKSVPQGIGGGVAEMIAGTADVLGAFGQADSMAVPWQAAALDTPDARRMKKEAAAQAEKVKTQGIDMSSEAGDIFRQRSKDIMPDPSTTHASAQIVAGLGNFTTKAVGYTMTMGPFAGATALGADVGLTESDRLKQEGVDLATRTKAGAVAGVLAGASVLIPMTGATKLSRFAKGVAVGEGTIVGQSLAEKAILKAAGYDKISDTFDPYDPVALALGVVPGALGAKFGHAAAPAPKPGAPTPRPLFDMGLTERQALKYNDVQLDAYAVKAAQKEGIPPEVLLAVKNAGERSASTATSPKGAQGVMQFMPDTFKQFGRGDATDPINSIDAGAKYLKNLHDTYGDWDAAIAHYNGGAKQAVLVRGGARPSFPETAKYLDNVKAYLGKTADDHIGAAVKAEPDLVAAARVQQTARALESSRLTAADDIVGMNLHTDALELAADQLGRGERVQIPEPLAAHIIDAGQREANFKSWFGDSKVVDEVGAPLVVYHGTNADIPNFDAARSRDAGIWLTPVAGAAEMYSGARPGANIIPAFASLRDPYFARVGESRMDALMKAQDGGHDGIVVKDSDGSISTLAVFAPEQIKSAIGNSGRYDPNSASLTDPIAKFSSAVDQLRAAREPETPPKTAAKEAAPAEPKAPVTPESPAAPQSEPAKPNTAEAPAQAAIDRAAAEVSMLNPDMLVQLDGMNEPVRVGDLLESVKKEATEDVQDSRLIEIAATCALTT